MYQEITFSMFCDAFARMDRKNNFSYDGLRALYDYLEEYEESTGEKVELDVIALCVEYTEYESFTELKKEYSDIETLDDLRDKTTVIEITPGVEDGALIIQQF
jgi:hypothetical protein